MYSGEYDACDVTLSVYLLFHKEYHDKGGKGLQALSMRKGNRDLELASIFVKKRL
jgi:hypothetical protein